MPETPIAQDDSITSLELLKLRVQLSWNWFEFHARQRMTMFYNFLIITGILVNGYGIAAKEGFNGMAAAVSLLGLLQAVGFLMIDIRSRELIGYGEDALEKLERDFIFPDTFVSQAIRRDKVLGLLRRDSDLREGKAFSLSRLRKMKYWMRSMYLIVLAAFSLALADSGVRFFCGHALFKRG